MPAAAPNGGYLRIAADQRWLQTVIRFRARHRARRRLFASPTARPGAGSDAQNSFGSPKVACPAVPGAVRRDLPAGRTGCRWAAIKEVADNAGLAVAAYECDERSARLWSWRLDRAQ